MTTDEAVDLYKGMWEWIRDNRSELRKGGNGVIHAKLKYMQMVRDKSGYANPFYLGNCIFCVAYEDCGVCPLNYCYDSYSPYDTVSSYLSGLAVDEEMAKIAFNTIIRAHEDLKNNPTDLLRRSV